MKPANCDNAWSVNPRKLSVFASPAGLGAGLKRCLLAIGIVLAGAGQAQAQSYHFFSLGTLGSARPTFYNTPVVNNMGQSAGTLMVNNLLQATLWNTTAPTTLSAPNGGPTYGSAVNDLGQVAGAFYPPPGPWAHAALWDGTNFTDLGTLGGTGSGAFAINNAGQIAGGSYTAGNAAQHAALWSGTTVTDLGTLGGPSSIAMAINNQGQVAGYSDLPANGGTRAVVWNGTTPTALPSVGWFITLAYGINNSGQVVGWGLNGPAQRALLWNVGGAAPIVLPGFGGSAGDSAYAINNLGTVAGTVSLANNSAFHAVLWSGGVMTDLNTVVDVDLAAANLILAQADGINDLGWVTGRSRNLATGLTDAFLLIPIPPPPPAPPLPAPLAPLPMAP